MKALTKKQDIQAHATLSMMFLSVSDAVNGLDGDTRYYVVRYNNCPSTDIEIRCRLSVYLNCTVHIESSTAGQDCAVVSCYR